MAEKILIIDDDIDTLKLVGLMLQKQGYEISAASNGALGLAKALEERPDLVLLDVMMPDMDGYEVARRLRKNPVTSSTPILMFTAKTQLDDKVTGFEAGVDDYLTKPTHPTELQAHVRALLARSPKKTSSAVAATPAEKRSYVIGVFAARAGLGVSSVAVNLAAAIYSRAQADVVLAEFTPGAGSLALELAAPGQKGLSDLLKTNPAEITRERVQSALVAHPSGIKFLFASENPREVALHAQTQQFGAIAARLTSLARFVVLDLGSGLPLFSQKILSSCSERILVVEGSQNTIYRSKLMLEALNSLNIPSAAVTVVLNHRVRTEVQLTVAQAQESLGQPILMTFMPAPELFLQGARAKTAPMLTQPANMTAQQFVKLGDLLIEREKAR
ncbi:MAG: hypothetical protein Fur002_18220 [Anaerolineales bacterium]